MALFAFSLLLWARCTPSSFERTAQVFALAVGEKMSKSRDDGRLTSQVFSAGWTGWDGMGISSNRVFGICGRLPRPM